MLGVISGTADPKAPTEFLFKSSAVINNIFNLSVLSFSCAEIAFSSYFIPVLHAINTTKNSKKK
jgi:hypothetical protein